MNVAYLCLDPGIPVFGAKGASVHVQEVVRALRDRGHDVTVHCTRLGESRPADLDDLPVVVDPRPRASSDGAEREQVVARASADLAASIRRCDLVYERYSLFSAAGATLARRVGAPFVLEVNAPLIDEQRSHRELHDEGAAIAATRTSFAAADVVACVSAPVARWVTSLVPDAATLVVPNGVNTRRFRPALQDQDDRFRVGFVGTLKPWHGTDVLLRAFARSALLHAELLICGDGPERPALEQLAAELGIARQTRFTGPVAPVSVPGLLASLDVAVAPYPETSREDAYFSPLKLYEYFAAGLAVIASDTGQVSDVVSHGSTGILVRPGSVDDLAQALIELSLDPVVRRRLGAAARRRAEEHHDWAGVVTRVLASAGLAREVDR